MYPYLYPQASLPHDRNNSTASMDSSRLQNHSYNQYAAAESKNLNYQQNQSQYRNNSSDPQNHSHNQYVAAESKNLNYQQNQSQDRKYHASNEQLMTGLSKFVRRYESEFLSPIKISDDRRILSTIYSQ
jgi:hypothetical protein